MESYPLDLVQHLTPTLMVGGLLPATTPPTATSQPSSDTKESSVVARLEKPPPTSAHTISQPWAKMVSKLLMQATGSNTPTTIWDPPRPLANLQVMLVDKRIFRFPPRKRPPPASSDSVPPTQLHSPLSPLSPGSPLFPDGIMTPVWIRKHREMCPAVWVDFYELKDQLPSQQNEEVLASSAEPLGIRSQTPQQVAQIRKMDADLVKEIVKTRRHVLGGILPNNERGAYAGVGRYAVVVCLQPHHMTTPNIEARLTTIRQECNMDNRTLLYLPFASSTPTDTPNQELTDFISSLAKHLNESTIAHYRDHTKRVRRKKAKVLPPALPPHAVAELRGNPNHPSPLGAQGWHMRYEYKLGSFAEFRGEIDIANKHYETCHSQLLEMFASTVTLPPRTKRWAEAKVLADCLNFKICKLYMYMDGTAQAMAQFNRHIARFRDFSNGWGIGVDTFEYWAWLCKQYRALGDLIDMALRNGYKLPTSGIVPPTAPSAITAAASAGQHQPLNTMQNPGYYYYAAARCTVERMKRFKRWIEAEGETEADVSSPRKGDTPALANERKLDHWELVIELLTKAYEQFKRIIGPSFNSTMPLSPRGGPSATGHSRLTLFLASEIANAYAERNRPAVEGQQVSDAEMALKFYERIAKTYRRDGWYDILGMILSTTRDCARQLKKSDIVLETCLEQLSPSFSLDITERTKLQDEIDSILTMDIPKSRTIKLDLAQIPCFFDFRMHFVQHTSYVGQSIPFQLCIFPLQNSIIRNVPVDSLEIHFGNPKIGSIILNQSEATAGEAAKESKIRTRLLKIGNEVDVDLTLQPRTVNVLQGQVTPHAVGEVTISKIVIKRNSTAYPIEFHSNLQGIDIVQRLDTKQHWFDGEKWIALPDYTDYTKLAVVQKPPRVELMIDADRAAFIDESFPIEITIVNNEEEVIRDVVLDIKLATVEGEQNATSLSREMGEYNCSTSIDAILLGQVSVQEQIRKTVYLVAKDHTSDRTLTFHVSYNLSSGMENGFVAEEDAAINNVQMVQTKIVTLRVVKPFSGRFQLDSDFDSKAIPDLLVSDPTARYWLHADITNESQDDLHIMDQAIEWIVPNIKPHWTSLTDERIIDRGEMDWPGGCVFSSSHIIDVSGSPEMPLGWYTIQWKRGNGAIATTRFAIEAEIPLVEPLRIVARLPPKAELQKPFTVTYDIFNESAELALLQISMEPPVVTDSCVYSGTKSKTIMRIPAFSSDNPPLHQTIIPLQCGRLALPRLVAFNTRKAAEDIAPVSVPVRCTGQSGTLGIWVLPRFPDAD